MKLGDPVRTRTRRPRDPYNNRTGVYAGTHLGEVCVDFRADIPVDDKGARKYRAGAYFRPEEVERA